MLALVYLAFYFEKTLFVEAKRRDGMMTSGDGNALLQEEEAVATSGQHQTGEEAAKYPSA